MCRAPRSVPSHARRKKVFKQTKGMRGRRKNTITTANAAVDKSLQHNYIGRKERKRNFRALWIQRINAACASMASPTADLSAGSPAPVSRSTARFCPTSPSTSPPPSRLWWIRRRKPKANSTGAIGRRLRRAGSFPSGVCMTDIAALQSEILAADRRRR